MHIISKFRYINNSVNNDLYILTIEKHFEEYVVYIVYRCFLHEAHINIHIVEVGK